MLISLFLWLYEMLNCLELKQLLRLIFTLGRKSVFTIIKCVYGPIVLTTMLPHDCLKIQGNTQDEI